MYVKGSSFGGVKLTKSPEPDNNSYSWCDISFDVRATSSLSSVGFGKNRVVLGVDLGSYVHAEH